MSTSQKTASLYPRFAGVDLGQKHDFSVVAVVEKKNSEAFLVHLKRFPLGSEYQSVLGYLKLLNAKLTDLRRILIDQTGVGEVFVEEAIKSGLKNAQGIALSGPKKQDVLVYLKQLMQNGSVHIPFDMDLINELNVERFELNKNGQLQFSHPHGTHDDRLWAFALAVYSSRPTVPEYHPVVVAGRSWKPHLPRPVQWPGFYAKTPQQARAEAENESRVEDGGKTRG